MISKYFLIAVAIAGGLPACSTAYKAGQTPDDVYYSPAKEAPAYVQMDERKDTRYNSYEDPDDQYLRMMVRNRNRWSSLDPYYYNSFYGINNPYFYGYNSIGTGFNTPWNNYWYWNSYYNPYMPPVVVVPGYYYPTFPVKPGSGVTVPKTTTIRPQPFNPYSYKNGYSNNNGTNNTRTNSTKANSSFRNGNTNAGSFNNSNRSQYRNSDNGSRYTPPPANNSYTPTRTYNPGSSSGSSSSGSGRSGGSTGGGGGVSRPGRGGN